MSHPIDMTLRVSQETARRCPPWLSSSLVLLAVLSLLTLSGCEDAGGNASAADGHGPLTGRLTITGSSTVAPLMADVARRFERLHPAVRVDVQTGGSGRGIADARSGAADIGMASRALKKGEEDLTAFRVAADGVCLIVHKDNPVKSLTAEQVVGLYTDRINNWSTLGGADGPVTVAHKAEGRATLEVFLKHFKLENPTIKPDVIVGHNEQGVKTVAGSAGAIGYVSIGTAEANANAGIPIKLLPLEGVEATTSNVASGAFPMSRPLNLLTRPSPRPLVKAFIQFAQSEAVHDLVASHYFVPVQSAAAAKR